MEVLPLQVGKTYINREESEVVKIIRYDESESIYRFVGNNGVKYGPAGGYLESFGEHRRDLVREVSAY